MKADAVRKQHWDTINRKTADKFHECWTYIVNGKAM